LPQFDRRCHPGAGGNLPSKHFTTMGDWPMPCELEVEANDYFSGTSLYSKPQAHRIKETSVYLPPNYRNTNPLNVVVWLHGFFVKNNRFLFKDDGVNVRQRVLNSNRNVVLIAPFMGYEYFDQNDKAVGDFSTSALGQGKWGQQYLTEVLKGLANHIDAKSPPQLEIKNLILACHSGGGTAMRGLVGTLGTFRGALRECWGFDCLYGGDDANFWSKHATSPDGCPVYVYFGDSTIPQSVKLYLMAKGMADTKGNAIVPPTPARNEVHVGIGHYDAFPMAGQMVDVGAKTDAFGDGLITQAPGPKTPVRGKEPDGAYVARAVANFKKNFAFVPGIHYTIARKYFEDRLRAVALP
jgi:Putative esterase